MKLTVFGLGGLGAALVANLLEDGRSVSLYNRTASKAEAFAARSCATPEEAVEPGGTLVTALADDAAVRALVTEEVLARLGPGGLHVSTSTISAELSRELAERAGAHGVAHVTAAVLGRPDSVRARGQVFMVSGEEGAVARALPLLESLGKGVFRFGADPGAASLAKLAMNFMLASAMETMSEAFALLEKGGVDPELLYQAATSSVFSAPVYKNYGRIMLDGAWRTPMFRLELGLKDMGLACDAARNLRVPMRTASLLRDQYLAAVARGKGELDWSGLAEVVREDAGLA